MQSKQWHLAQLNIATMLGSDISDPVMKDFVNALDAVNAVAENSPGFVWRLKDDSNNATNINPFGDSRIIVNMSVWESIEDLEAFVYKSQHADVLRRRKEWFSKMKLYMVMWYVPAGTVPSIDEAKSKLYQLESNGPSPHAFDLRNRFSPPQAEVL